MYSAPLATEDTSLAGMKLAAPVANGPFELQVIDKLELLLAFPSTVYGETSFHAIDMWSTQNSKGCSSTPCCFGFIVDRIIFGNQKNWTQSSRTAFSAKMMAPHGASTEAIESITALLLDKTRVCHLVHHGDIRAGVDHTVALKCELRPSEPTRSILRLASCEQQK